MAEPGKIEVQLSLLSGQDTAAAKDLASSIKEIAESFKWLRSADYKQSAENLARLYETIKQRHDEVTKMVQGNAPGSGGGPSRSWQPSDVAQAAKGTEAAADTSAEAERERRAQAAKADQEYRQSEKERQDKLRQDQAEQVKQAAPQAAQERIDKWMQEKGVHYEQAEGDGGVDLQGGGWRIPRYGKLNVQDFLNRLRDRNLRKIRDNPDSPDVQEQAEGRANFWQFASNRAGDVYAAQKAFQGISGFLTRENVNPLDFTDVGAQLGYSRDSNPLSQILGMQTPFSAAGAEGARQAKDSLKLRWQAGINQQQAQAIIGATAGAGFSGNLGSDIRMDLMAPLTRRYGVNPQEIVPFLQVLRTGTGNIEQLNRVLGDMGEAARSANLTLSEYNKNLAGSAEATQALGGGAIRGAEFGREFMTGTGLPSSIGDQLSQNPMVQSFTAAATGVPAMAQGALPVGARMRGIRATVNALMPIFGSGLSGLEKTTAAEVKDPDTGQVVGREKPGNYGLAAVATRLGVSPDALSQFMNTEDRQARVEAFNVRADTYEQQMIGAASNPHLSVQRREGLKKMMQAEMNRGGGGQGGLDRYRYNAKGEIEHSDASGDWSVVADRKKVHEMAADWATDRAHGGTKQWNQLRDAAVRICVDKDELKDAEQIKDTRKRTERVRQLVSESSREAEAQYHIAMTPLTKKFFKVLASDQNTNVDWNADAPRNAPAATPQGPKQLSPRTNPGSGPTHG